MSRLDELIAELCPNGVEFEEIGKLCKVISAPKKLNKKEYKNIGLFPIIDQGQNFIVGYTNDSSAVVKKGEYVIFGDHTREIKFVNFEFCQGADGIKILLASKNIKPRFLYHIMLGLKIANRGYNRHWSLVSTMSIPVPPIPVQEEIVRILDNFAELTAELTAELSKRKQQYQYYRDMLLTFDSIRATSQTDRQTAVISVVWMTIKNICRKVSSGGTPSTSTSEYYGGNIPWLRTQEINWNEIYDTEVKITEFALKNSSAKIIPENCVIVAMYGATAAKAAINRIRLSTNQACCNLEIDKSIALYRYVFYWISSQYDNIKNLGQGSQSNINAGIIKDYPIPVPPLEEQERIVAILDRFDALCNDLTSGLPAEIEARKKQYEYYRDKLLTFKEAV